MGTDPIPGRRDEATMSDGHRIACKCPACVQLMEYLVATETRPVACLYLVAAFDPPAPGTFTTITVTSIPPKGNEP